MHILVIDGGHVEAEFREKFGAGHEYSFHSCDSDSLAELVAKQKQLVILAAAAGAAFCYSHLPGTRPYYKFKCPIFIDCAARSLSEMLSAHEPDCGPPDGTLFGFCGLPTLLNRSLLEVSLYHEADREKLADTCAALGTDYRVVEDRVGLVTPRVVCMIINEACYTVQEGAATMQDVDLAMRLGTNYPRGPFAWANAIGVARVYAVLEALWDDTHDERYKICPLLKRQALRGEPFAV
ncbi:3-hydroxyacyl-CoA dehydrogenase family protein [Hymenobacter sp.]|uniref:3-hydroxyacyl-CoA dehydrogenase family protein n=1 Tax=Hymenobacter sp. TaxID=1898978 RepID=UPI002869FCE2|nr:3-hydroxyacyl-CoA dehydrogenase family protein [Hymenobacter sp.]